MRKWFRDLRILVRNVWHDISGSLKSPKPAFVIFTSVVFIGVGQIGIVIPVFPGLLFTLPGLILLSLYSPTVYTTLKSKVAGHPRIESMTDRTHNWLVEHIKTRQ